MLSVLKNRTYATLFAAQVVALLGTGLLTVALGLLAFDIAGGDGGIVMGTAMTIKIAAYVFVGPIATALVASLPRKAVLVAADLTRALVALALPFVDQAWHIYVLIFVLQCASATFTPMFQAIIPSVLPDECDYTKALSLSRLAYDLESLVSPALAAALLAFMSYNNLFLGTVGGFFASAALVAITVIPAAAAAHEASFWERATRGVREFFRISELRGLMALNLTIATTTAMVLVNTVMIVQGALGRNQSSAAILLGAYGAGSMIGALAIPGLLERKADRSVMLAGAAALPILLALGSLAILGADGPWTWPALLVLWLLIGAATSVVLTPSARLLKRNSTEGNRPAIYAAQFSLSHACYLMTYPLAGIAGAQLGLPQVGLMLSALGALGVVAALALWSWSERRNERR